MGRARGDRLARLDRRDAHSIHAAALLARGSAGVGHQRRAFHPGDAGTELLEDGSQDPERLVLAHGNAHRHPRRAAVPSHRGDAVRRGRLAHPAGTGPGKSIRPPHARRSARGWRREDGPGPESHARRHAESRLRAGRGRPGQREPDRVRGVLRGAASLLSRGSCPAQSPQPVLLAPHRRRRPDQRRPTTRR